MLAITGHPPTHKARVTVTMPVTMDFEFDVVDSEDTIKDMQGEAQMVMEAYARKVLGMIKEEDSKNRLLTFTSGRGEISQIVVSPFVESR